MVKLTQISTKTSDKKYSDGDVEDTLLKIFKKGLSQKEKERILLNNPSWAMRYHLSPKRGNLLNWYQFHEKSNVLEVGSGCGAITEVLVKNENINVVAVELSERRAKINYYRNKNAKNLEIIIGNLQDYKPKEKFDYIVCVGVLEYAGTFIDSDSPYEEFVRILKSFLKPDGKILIAIENKLGFKYLSGSREDHTGGYFDGINNYPQQTKVRTFGRRELKGLMEKSGLTVERFYYPHPDYKIPDLVFSDDYAPGHDSFIPKNLLPSPNFDQSRKELFNEQLFVSAIEDNKLYKELANSFMVESTISGSKHNESNSVVFSLTRGGRGQKNKTRTTAYKSTSGIRFKKEALNASSVDHIIRLEETFNLLNQRKASKDYFIARPLNLDRVAGSVEYDHIPGKNVEDVLIKLLINEDFADAADIIKKYKKILKHLATQSDKASNNSINLNVILDPKVLDIYNQNLVIKEGILDFNLDNFIIDSKTGKWGLIDYEWRLDTPLPIEFIEYRGLVTFLSRHRNMISSRGSRTEVVGNNVMAVHKEFLELMNLSVEKLNRAYLIENEYIQPLLFGHKVDFEPATKVNSIINTTYYIDQAEELIKRNHEQLILLSIENDNLKKDIYNINNSRSYKMVRRAANMKNKLQLRKLAARSAKRAGIHKNNQSNV